MSEIGYYAKMFRGFPSGLYVLGGGIAMRTNRTGEWFEMDPTLSPTMIEWDWLSNSRYDEVLTEKEAARIAEGWGTTLPQS